MNNNIEVGECGWIIYIGLTLSLSLCLSLSLSLFIFSPSRVAHAWFTAFSASHRIGWREIETRNPRFSHGIWRCLVNVNGFPWNVTMKYGSSSETINHGFSHQFDLFRPIQWASTWQLRAVWWRQLSHGICHWENSKVSQPGITSNGTTIYGA